MRPVLAVGLVVGSIGFLAGCTTRTGGAAPDRSITVWSLESLPTRIAATKKIANRFERRTGIGVRLVGGAKARLPQLVMSGAASDTPPDVIGAVPMGLVWQRYGRPRC